MVILFSLSLHFLGDNVAIVSIKKGAYLLKCGRRGKPKFCPFRLSTDEKFLIWYSGQEERQLRLSSVVKVIPGQKTVSFQRQLQPEKESHSFSLIYANGERSLDLICKDKGQADAWVLGLRVISSRCNHSKPFNSLRSHRGAQSCISSPAGFIRRKYNLGLSEDDTELSQVHNICGSPSLSLSERCFSDGLSNSSGSFYWSEAALSTAQNVVDISIPNSPYIEPDHHKRRYEENVLIKLAAPSCEMPRIENKNILQDVMIWGENVEGILDGTSNKSSNENLHVDVLLPKLFESTSTLDILNMSLGGKHAALVTKEGEIFCWGEAKGGRLGHKIDVNVSYPKHVDSLSSVQVKTVVCSEYQTHALTHSGELYVWGDTGFDSLVGEEKSRSQWLPHKISGPLDGITISNIACGEWHSAVVSTSGQLFTWGDGTFGVLGHGNVKSLPQPKEVESLKGLWVKSVACGSWHTAAIVEIINDHFKFSAIGGKLFTWGDGDKRRLGHADEDKKLLPTCVAQLVDHDFVQVCCGRMLTVGLTSHGTVYTMGSAIHGQLGNPQAKDRSITIVEGKLKEEFIKKIASGSYHVAALTTTGRVYSWGKGANGQLGLGDGEDRNTPTLVEALEDRQIESIICGSNSTAAICLHRSVSVTDQSACSGCKVPFGFTKKKHNCYNCGLHFCHSCSSKKAINASLAPNKSKAFRVCDRCFTNLRGVGHLARLFKLDHDGIKQPLNERKGFLEETESRGAGAATPKYGKLMSANHSSNSDSQFIRRISAKIHGEDQLNLESNSSFLGGQPHWGQVLCPPLFDVHHREVSVGFNLLSKTQSSPAAASEYLESNMYSTSTADNVIFESDEILIEEVRRLRAQVRSLEKKCQMGCNKIQESQQKIEETWSLARDEAAKCKAAKEVIKALALRLHKISDDVSGGKRKDNDGVDRNLPPITPVYAYSPCLKGVRPESNVTELPCVGVAKDRHSDSISNSPILFSDTLKFMYGSDACRDSKSEEESRVGLMESQTKDVKLEWVEQYEPGVYITFTILPSGQKGLKRVRFSRRRFTEKEAERWWEENQKVMCQNYNIEGYVHSSQS
ncbi:PH, RCC1 and FYVE domains-containing protein 1 isoform X2 [Humulus lupulus]|uniref:PH, RCC1 and FYVE domains-containing protein 1 isoform X2 n=1 Tax=Humulus lupulus TaxID=3486 RepID=UPI002B418340|nr:PH, RCC1 and FYVE domains-containing protein 1 isoform X2 [Humulus lupulus]